MNKRIRNNFKSNTKISDPVLQLEETYKEDMTEIYM